ncbi:MAG: phage tail protein [Brevundimonas sp.]|uniref:phage tail sheath subtilisin-like domain-containing protein n=1 Tax=Brevundimonas sp. TaxID=1871086 RepID=UPI000DBC1FC7|nr:phage tail sheath subtilisin-like domain-containing protein [Brevundimonas sp.]PZU62219.1 MAG: phage tail protein [Brevundimonas sp.]
MFDTPHHGLRFAKVTTALTAFRVVATSVIGLVAVASDAEAATFPLDTPVVLTALPAAIADAGSEGTLRGALKAIDDQVRTIVVVVRVAEGTDEDAEAKQAETNAAVIAGLGQLERAEQLVGVKPRILGAPGLDTPGVAAALATLAPKLGAFAYARAIGATVAEQTAYRDTFSARELMLIAGDFTAASDDIENPGAVTSHGVARALGLRARIDQDQGFNKTLSNVGVAGVLGVTDPVTWDLQSSATEAGVLNAADVTCIIQRNGFRFWGNHTCSDDPDYMFESAVRTDQVIRDTIADGVFPYMDRPLRRSLVRDLIESINALFRDLKAQGLIIGAECWYPDELNTEPTLTAGKLRLAYKFTDTPPLEDLGIAVEKTGEFFIDFAAGL